MPISQDRMIRVINAGLNALQGCEQARELVVMAEARIFQGIQSWQEAFEGLKHSLSINILTNAELRAELRIEAEYFRRNARRNEAAARWKARDRADREGRPVPVSAQLLPKPLNQVTRGPRRERKHTKPTNQNNSNVIPSSYDDEAEANRELAAMNQDDDLFSFTPGQVELSPEALARLRAEIDAGAQETINVQTWEETKASLPGQSPSKNENEKDE